MDTEVYKINRILCDFLDGLFFGFGFVTLLVLSVYLLFKNEELKIFIYQSILVAKYLAIFYFIIYLSSLTIYYSSNEFDFFNIRATGPYAWAYWYMLLRPLIFCALLQLFWIRKITYKMRYTTLIALFVLIISLFSGSFFERFVIIVASYNRQEWIKDTSYNAEILILMTSYIVEKCILFCAMVFITYLIKKPVKI